MVTAQWARLPVAAAVPVRVLALFGGGDAGQGGDVVVQVAVGQSPRGVLVADVAAGA
ncbi:hypothetical protein [Nonomuraea longicatena]|uniref:Uncharacterized protein n=1 Tax=Nonomuraea longicatena TaxID=83682 RepID=A0ABN1QWX7_9ACTN